MKDKGLKPAKAGKAVKAGKFVKGAVKATKGGK